MNDTPLDRLSALCGIAPEYYDIGGTRHAVSEQGQRRLLRAMGVACEDDAECERSIAAVEARRWRRRLAPVAVAREGESEMSLTLTAPESQGGDALEWQLHEESGRIDRGVIEPAAAGVLERRSIEGEPWIGASFAIPLPATAGYHRLELRRDAAPRDVLADCLVVVAPERCHRPEALDAGERIWGITAQLYGLRSQRNWGIGDFTDLMRLVELAADHGADFVGLNPLHAASSYEDADASPYNPSSRMFLNALYLDVEAIPDFVECEAAQQLVADETFQAVLRSLRGADLVDYAAVGAAKHQVLELLFDSFRRRHRDADSERARAFRAFRDSRDRLHEYTSFQVLHEHLREQDENAWGWPAWPEPLRDSRSAAVAQLVAGRGDRAEFFAYLQWNADAQLAAAARRARELGMHVGIYADLALSAKHGGADTWIDRHLFVNDAHIGAPPDDFNQAGQDWGLPPWHPELLRDDAYRPFIETLRANMTLGGALRIDHVMALLRCFLIPAGSTPADGAYVHYRFDEMLAILALESRRNGCAVIGEDLGTVPDEVRSGLGEVGALGYRVLYFEKDGGGAFKAPEAFDAEALTVASTHDLPTLAGFWQGRDIEWRTRLDLFPSPEHREQQIISRAEDRAKLVVALEKQGLAPADGGSQELSAGTGMSLELRCALHAYLARSASKLVGVQAEDLLGEREQANLPGTTSEHPNWRRRLALQLESWTEEPAVEALFATMRRERPGAERRPSGNERKPGGGATPAAATTAAPGRSRARIPRATYRVQLHAGFRFADLAQLVPYLDALGISHCYCSPYLKARPGSLHGYDIVDHNALNPEIGTREDFDRLCDTLAEHGMGQILDMVPNHVAVMGRDNAWWLDVLENGPASHYAQFFDIDWQPLKEALRGKVLLPILGDHYGNVLDTGELELRFDEALGSFAVEYYEHLFPVDPREYPRILEPDLEQLRNRLAPDDPALVVFESLVTAFAKLPSRARVDEDSRRERGRDQRLHQGRLAELAEQSPDIGHYIDECVRAFNGDEHYPADKGRLHGLLEAQAYRLAYWRVASHEINYRRFFDINELASLRMENEEVFETTHALAIELVAAGRLDGLRIDHPDGLYDPRGYFRALQQRAGGEAYEPGGELPLYIVAEKILAGGEPLREDWPIHGTTGYEFANLATRFLVDPKGVEELGRIYAAFVGRDVDYADVLVRAKRLIMRTSLASELNVLAAELDRLAEQDPHTRDFGLGGLRNALFETVACFPVYRTYVVDAEVAAADEAAVGNAVDTAKRLSEAADTSAFEFVRNVLLNRSHTGRSAALRERVTRFVMQMQQYTSPVAAKGMEDTAFYRYGRLISLNEVGGTPEHPSVTIEALHGANETRGARWPHSMLASSTHDTKRSEDVRARIDVLSELPSEWGRRVELWARVNEPLKRPGGDGMNVPDREIEYFLYQSLLGAWPLAPLEGPDREQFTQRMTAYITKAAKEAKRHTSWINPSPEYEAALQAFTAALLDPAGNGAFVEDFLPFQQRVARLGLYNALTQLLLKLTAPGVPDIYQGNELWRFDLVDPDNRRAVDFAERPYRLDELRGAFERSAGRAMLEELMDTIEDGRIKLFVTWRALAVRREHPALFERGAYRPLRVNGEAADHVCAFAREADDATLVTAVLRGFAGLAGGDGRTFDAARLGNTSIELPRAAGKLVDAFTNEAATPGGDEAARATPGGGSAVRAEAGGERVRASDLFAALPVALLVSGG